MKKGFTLIEMLFVLMIIGVLAAVSLPYFEGIKNESKITRAETELSLLKNAIETYYQYTGRFPDNITSDLTGSSPKLLRKIMSDPFKTDKRTIPPTYGYENNGTYYIVFSIGLDTLSKNWTIEGNTISRNVHCQNIIESDLEIR